MTLVLGVDAGGTASRAVVATDTGEPLGRGESGGGNPIAHDVEVASERIARCVRQALAAAGADASQVGGAVVGLAGQGALANPAMSAVFGRMWRGIGMRTMPTLVPDPLLAFVSGTPERTGSVLLAGTGAAALGVRDLAVAGFADGDGWLLGDEGSGFWLGRAAARLAIRQCAQGRRGELARLVAEEFNVDTQMVRVSDVIASRAHDNPVGTLAADYLVLRPGR